MQEDSTAVQPWDSLRKLILVNRYKSGDRLPSERELAQQLGIGRPAVREAIKVLTVLDILQSKPGAGTFIKSASSLMLNWPEATDLRLDFDLLQLLEVRKMVEPQAAALCAVRATPQQIEELESHLNAQAADTENREAAVRLDFLFHDVLLRAAANPILDDVIRFLSPVLVRSRQLTAFTAPDLHRMVREHSAIFEAIRRRQPDLAYRAMSEHLGTVGLDLLTAPMEAYGRSSDVRQ